MWRRKIRWKGVLMYVRVHRKKSFSIFPSSAGMPLTKLSLGGNYDVIYKLFLPRESLVSDMLARDGNIKKLFYGVNTLCVTSFRCGTYTSARPSQEKYLRRKWTSDWYTVTANSLGRQLLIQITFLDRLLWAILSLVHPNLLPLGFSLSLSWFAKWLAMVSVCISLTS